MDAFKILILSIFIFLHGCCSPSECKPAKDGFQIYEPIILALNKFKLDSGSYPASLSELLPNYINKIPTPEGSRPSPVEYINHGNSYQLKFTYGGPGLNWCTYTPATKWGCTGIY